MTRPKPELRMLVEFLWRTIFGYTNVLQNRLDFNEGFAQNLQFHLLSVGTSILHTMSPGDGMTVHSYSPKLLDITKAFTEEYNDFIKEEWSEIMTSGYPQVMAMGKLELAAAVRIDRLTDTIFSIYQNQEV